MSNPGKPDKSPREIVEEILFAPPHTPAQENWRVWKTNLLYEFAIRCLKAGARLGWEARNAEITLEDGCKLRTWAYFNEWWASLEGEK